MWYGNPPFRINHFAKRTVDLEWENQYSISGSNLLTVSITYLPDGKFLVEVMIVSLFDVTERLQSSLFLPLSFSICSKIIYIFRQEKAIPLVWRSR